MFQSSTDVCSLPKLNIPALEQKISISPNSRLISSIILVNSFKEHPKVPAIEQKLSTATAAQNIMLALNAMKYSCIWRTGKLAFNKSIQKSIGLNENQEIIGFIYVGTETGKKKQIPTLGIDEFVAYL